MNKIVIDAPACSGDRINILFETDNEKVVDEITEIMKKVESDGDYTVTIESDAYKTSSVSAIMAVANVISGTVAVKVEPDETIKKGGD